MVVTHHLQLQHKIRFVKKCIFIYTLKIIKLNISKWQKKIKFTKDEVIQIDNLKQEVASIFTRLGQLSVEKKRRIDEVEKVESDLLNQHQELVEKEKQIFAGLNEKYGDGNYDPNTNEFTPIEKEEAKSKEVKK